jgi:hypothetical protein
MHMQPVLWIRISMDPHQTERKDQDPDQDPHQSDKLDPDPHQFADDNPQCREYEPI